MQLNTKTLQKTALLTPNKICLFLLVSYRAFKQYRGLLLDKENKFTFQARGLGKEYLFVYNTVHKVQSLQCLRQKQISRRFRLSLDSECPWIRNIFREIQEFYVPWSLELWRTVVAAVFLSLVERLQALYYSIVRMFLRLL